MNFKKNQGFTLVELIVVIAILGLLAGIGIPMYSGYVEKAQIAVDEQNVVMLSNAFQVACVGNNLDPASVNAALEWNGQTVVGLLTLTPRGGEDPYEDTKKDFKEFIGGGIEFKVYTSNDIHFGDGGFFVGQTHTYTDKNGNTYTVTLKQDQIDALNKSTYMTNSQLGTEGLLSKLGEVSDFAAIITSNDSSDAYNAVLESADFQKALAGYLGVSADDPDAVLEKLGEISGDDNDKIDKIMANATILYAAENAQKLSNEDINSMFADGAKDVIIGNLNKGDTTTAMSQAALAYGMYTAYAYQSGNEELIEKTKNPINILNGLDDDGFQKYMAEQGGQTDLEGFLGGMGMITDGANDSGVAMDVLINGFNTEQLAGMLNSATGSTEAAE